MKKLKVVFERVANSNSGEYIMNLRCNGYHIFAAANTGSEISINGAKVQANFGVFQQTIQPIENVEITDTLNFNWSGAAPSNIVVTQFFFIDGNES